MRLMFVLMLGLLQTQNNTVPGDYTLKPGEKVVCKHYGDPAWYTECHILEVAKPDAKHPDAQCLAKSDMMRPNTWCLNKQLDALDEISDGIDLLTEELQMEQAIDKEWADMVLEIAPMQSDEAKILILPHIEKLKAMHVKLEELERKRTEEGRKASK